MQNSRLIQSCFPIKTNKVWTRPILRPTSPVSPMFIYCVNQDASPRVIWGDILTSGSCACPSTIMHIMRQFTYWFLLNLDILPFIVLCIERSLPPIAWVWLNAMIDTVFIKISLLRKQSFNMVISVIECKNIPSYEGRTGMPCLTKPKHCDGLNIYML